MADINYWLGRKYALLAQNADADTARAGAAVTSANASANLDTVRAGILPQQAASEIALQGAQTRLTGEQTKIVAPESRARISLIGSEIGLNQANTGLIKTNTAIAKREGLDKRSILPESLRAVLGDQFQLSDIVPQR